ncbi:unnamed protein product [Amoebophrya sp. A120]|nr:unnamed protein product [Amoebophrya sp. A120]|eukprot:GSA120T00014844001.1
MFASGGRTNPSSMAFSQGAAPSQQRSSQRDNNYRENTYAAGATEFVPVLKITEEGDAQAQTAAGLDRIRRLDSLHFFHALGRILYNKRCEPKADPETLVQEFVEWKERETKDFWQKFEDVEKRRKAQLLAAAAKAVQVAPSRGPQIVSVVDQHGAQQVGDDPRSSRQDWDGSKIKNPRHVLGGYSTTSTDLAHDPTTRAEDVVVSSSIMSTSSTTRNINEVNKGGGPLPVVRINAEPVIEVPDGAHKRSTTSYASASSSPSSRGFAGTGMKRRPAAPGVAEVQPGAGSRPSPKANETNLPTAKLKPVMKRVNFAKKNQDSGSPGVANKVHDDIICLTSSDSEPEMLNVVAPPAGPPAKRQRVLPPEGAGQSSAAVGSHTSNTQAGSMIRTTTGAKPTTIPGSRSTTTSRTEEQDNNEITTLPRPLPNKTAKDYKNPKEFSEKGSRQIKVEEFSLRTPALLQSINSSSTSSTTPAATLTLVKSIRPQVYYDLEELLEVQEPRMFVDFVFTNAPAFFSSTENSTPLQSVYSSVEAATGATGLEGGMQLQQHQHRPSPGNMFETPSSANACASTFTPISTYADFLDSLCAISGNANLTNFGQITTDDLELVCRSYLDANIFCQKPNYTPSRSAASGGNNNYQNHNSSGHGLFQFRRSRIIDVDRERQKANLEKHWYKGEVYNNNTNNASTTASSAFFAPATLSEPDWSRTTSYLNQQQPSCINFGDYEIYGYIDQILRNTRGQAPALPHVALHQITHLASKLRNENEFGFDPQMNSAGGANNFGENYGAAPNKPPALEIPTATAVDEPEVVVARPVGVAKLLVDDIEDFDDDNSEDS